MENKKTNIKIILRRKEVKLGGAKAIKRALHLPIYKHNNKYNNKQQENEKWFPLLSTAHYKTLSIQNLSPVALQQWRH